MNQDILDRSQAKRRARWIVASVSLSAVLLFVLGVCLGTLNR